MDTKGYYHLELKSLSCEDKKFLLHKLKEDHPHVLQYHIFSDSYFIAWDGMWFGIFYREGLRNGSKKITFGQLIDLIDAVKDKFKPEVITLRCGTTVVFKNDEVQIGTATMAWDDFMSMVSVGEKYLRTAK